MFRIRSPQDIGAAVVFIGIGLWILGVPLVIPLAILTFVSAFVPIIGALFAGFVAVLIALVSNGWKEALIVLAIIILVQQLEGNVFQPMLQSRGLSRSRAERLLVRGFFQEVIDRLPIDGLAGPVSDEVFSRFVTAQAEGRVK